MLPHTMHGEVARLLLSLADAPHEVQTSTDDGLAFVVPDELAARYEAATAPPAPAAPPDDSPLSQPARRRRRPSTPEA